MQYEVGHRTSAKAKLDKYGSAVDLHGKRVTLLEGSQGKVRTKGVGVRTHAHTAQRMHMHMHMPMPMDTTGVRQDMACTQQSREVPSAQ